MPEYKKSSLLLLQLLSLVSCGLLAACSTSSLSQDSTEDASAGRAWDMVFTGEVTPRAVFSEDDREPMPVDEYPWSAVGRLVMGGGHCTASLIARDLILTNAHCVLMGIDDDETPAIRLPQTLRFYPAYQPGNTPMYSSGQRVWLDDLILDRSLMSNPVGDYADWAIIRLHQPLGAHYGWIEPAKAFSAGEVSLGGYSGDLQDGEQPGLHRGCAIRAREDDDNSVLHDCDMTAGASGSPLVFFEGDKALIAALNSAEYGEHVRDVRYQGTLEFSEDAHNIAVPTETFYQQLAHIPPLPAGTHDYFVTFCNDLNDDVNLNLAHFDDEPLISFGPIEVAQGQCKEIHMGNRPDVDFYMAFEGRRIQSVGEQRICMNPGQGHLTALGAACDQVEVVFTQTARPAIGTPLMLSTVETQQAQPATSKDNYGQKSKPRKQGGQDYQGDRSGPNVIR